MTPKRLQPIELQIIAITDFHGYLRPLTDKSNGEIQSVDGPLVVGGAAYMATHIKRLREGHTHSLLLSNGDNFSGWPFEVAAFRNEPTVEFLNAIGVDVSSAGNHEFDVSADFLVRHMMNGESFGTPDVDSSFTDSAGRPFHGTDFDYISANVRDARSGELVLKPYIIKEIPDGYGGAIPVGIIGLTEEPALTREPMSVQAGVLYTESTVEAANRYAKELQKQGVQTIIALLHDGGTADSSGSDFNGCDGVRGPAIDFARQASPAIDVIITGHWHAAFNCFLDDPDGHPRPVVEGSNHGRLITEIRLAIDPVTKDAIRDRTLCVNHPNTRDVPEDPEIASMVSYWVERAKRKWAEPLAELTGDLTAARNEVGESPLGNLVADAFYAEARARGWPVDLAITFGVPKRDLLYAKSDHPEDRDGLVTFGKAVETFGVHQSELVVTLTGRQIKQILEEQWTRDDEGVITFSPLNVSWNVRYAYDPDQPLGERVSPSEIAIDGETIELDRTYRVGTAGSAVVNGGGYPTFLRHRDAIRIASRPVLDYIKNQRVLQEPTLTRVRILRRHEVPYERS